MSGLSRTPGKRVGANNPPRVRIPLSPPDKISNPVAALPRTPGIAPAKNGQRPPKRVIRFPASAPMRDSRGCRLTDASSCLGHSSALPPSSSPPAPKAPRPGRTTTSRRCRRRNGSDTSSPVTASQSRAHTKTQKLCAVQVAAPSIGVGGSDMHGAGYPPGRQPRGFESRSRATAAMKSSIVMPAPFALALTAALRRRD